MDYRLRAPWGKEARFTAVPPAPGVVTRTDGHRSADTDIHPFTQAYSSIQDSPTHLGTLTWGQH